MWPGNTSGSHRRTEVWLDRRMSGIACLTQKGWIDCVNTSENGGQQHAGYVSFIHSQWAPHSTCRLKNISQIKGTICSSISYKSCLYCFRWWIKYLVSAAWEVIPLVAAKAKCVKCLIHSSHTNGEEIYLTNWDLTVFSGVSLYEQAHVTGH